MLRPVKLLLLSVLFIFGLITAISLLIPSRIRISRAINIAAAPANLDGLLRDTARWARWHPGFRDSSRAAGIIIREQQGGSGEWNFLLQQGNKPPVLNGFRLYTFPGSDSATLQWFMDFRLSWYPWRKFGSLFYENTYGSMMEGGLSALREMAAP